MMNNKKLMSFILAGGLIAGAGFGYKAMASDEPTTQSVSQAQEQERGGRGFFGGRMMRGNGFCHGFGGYNSDLSAGQQKELNLLFAEAQNIMVDFGERMETAHEKLYGSIESGNREDILLSWNDMEALHDEIQVKIQPIKEKIAGITGEDVEDLGFYGGFGHDELSEIMTKLKDATEDDAKDIIDDLQDGRGFGRGGFMNRSNGHMGGMMGPGRFRGNWNRGGQDGTTK